MSIDYSNIVNNISQITLNMMKSAFEQMTNYIDSRFEPIYENQQKICNELSTVKQEVDCIKQMIIPATIKE